jgi:hypothetical protein
MPKSEHLQRETKAMSKQHTWKWEVEGEELEIKSSEMIQNLL